MTHRAGPITGAAARITGAAGPITRTPHDSGQNRPMPRRSRHALIALAGALALALTLAAPAFAEAPWWSIYAEAGPSHLPPGGEGHINIEVGDLGDREVNASKEPVKLRDALPAGLTAVSVTAFKDASSVKCPSGTLPAPLECTFSGVLHPYEQFAIQIKVKVEQPAGTVASLPDQVTVEGGGAPSATSTQHLTVSDEPTPFGVSLFELTPSEEDGQPATQAGAHPFQLTTTFVTNQAGGPLPVALPKDIRFTLPPGLVGNPTAVAQCSLAEFYRVIGEVDLCPPDSAVGVATVTAYEPKFGLIPKTVPLFNLEPSHGEPARLGFYVIGKIPIVIDTSVQTGGDYAVVATVANVTQVAGVLSSQVTLWGVPGDPRHNAERGWECVAGGAFAKQIEKPCPSTSQLPLTPFLTLPTSCQASPAAEPVIATTETDSWSEPGRFLGSEYAWMNGEGQPLGFQGCPSLPFAPTIEVAPEQHTASTPSGVTVTVKVPHATTLQAEGQAEADVRNTTVTLPEGVQLSPSAANGLEACPEGPEGGSEGVGFDGFKKFAGPGLEAQAETQTFTPTFRFVPEESEGRALAPSCPQASKLGTVEIETPLLPGKLKGYLYLASPAPNGEPGRNPFNSLVALYIVAEDSEAGVLVKLAGEGELSESSLRVVTTFRDAPQLPFSSLQIYLFGGPRASLATPARCGAYATGAAFTPWSSTGPVNVTSPAEEFAIGSGAEGSPCPGATLPFAPGLSAQSQSAQAGAFTSFGLELDRPDGDQALSGLSLHMPAGVAALLSAVELCSEAQASASSCPAASEIGTATAVAGLGPEPYVETGGKVFITGPYDGAPFGLEIVTPAVAGPFNLGFVTVRSKITVDRENASITIDTPSLPTQLRGIPLQLGRVLVSIDRPGFEFNPTNCAAAHIEGAVSGSEGASVGVSAPFRVENCQRLPFHPTLTASTNGKATKANGTDFVVKVTSGGTDSSGVAQAGIAKVDLQLPLQLPARLSTLQKACTERAFAANPASCPEGSVIGAATIHTPVLKSALAGPAYLVSHGNAAFPDVEFVLQGEGITLVLDGKTQIKNGITYSKFESAPDAPFTTFETTLPAGPHSALTANVPAKDDYDLCSQSLQMPTQITGQNGSVIEHDTRIAVQGCGQVKSAKAKKLTRAQRLALALSACRKKVRHVNRKKCEKKARARYGPVRKKVVRKK